MNYKLSTSKVSFAVVGCFALISLCYGETASPSTLAKVPPEIVTNVTLFAALNTNKVEVTVPIMLKAVLKNDSTNDVAVSLVSKVLDCELSVRNAAGESMPPTRFAKKMAKDASSLGEAVVTISPHGTHTYEIPVSRLYDMTLPGRYRVTAKVRVFARRTGQTGFFDVESRPLDVTVLRSAQE